MRQVMIGFAGLIVLVVAAFGATMVFPQIIEWSIRATCSMTAPDQNCRLRMMAMGHTWSLKGDLDRAGVWYRRAADAGSPAAMFHLAWLYEERGYQEFQGEARSRFERIQAELENDRPQNEVIPPSRIAFQHAADWYRASADHGFAPAMNNLADLRQSGLLGEKDLDQAFRLFLAAARAGNPLAAMNVSLAYRTGRGVLRDDIEAKKWATITANPSSPDLGQLTLSRTRIDGVNADAHLIAGIRASAEQHVPVTVNYKPLKPDPTLPTFREVQNKLRSQNGQH